MISNIDFFLHLETKIKSTIIKWLQTKIQLLNCYFYEMLGPTIFLNHQTLESLFLVLFETLPIFLFYLTSSNGKFGDLLLTY